MKPVSRASSRSIMASCQARTFSILLIGCGIFFALHLAFANTRPPTFKHLDEIPKKIWQSWKVDALQFEDRDSERARSWTIKNPAHRYEVLTDANALTYVRQHFGPEGFNRPDLIQTYESLEGKLKIIQADLLRYIIMYVEGGLWADIDVEAIKPINVFIPKRFDEKDIGMVIGVETDEPSFKDHIVLGSKAQSFCQWTFMCKPGEPAMMRLINGILHWLNTLAERQAKPISDLELDFDEVLSGTGPSAFTEAILTEMTIKTGKKITWETFTDMEESLLVGGTLVLPSEAFAAGTGHSKSGNHHTRRALVRHHFGASSWTSRHQRHKHPIYGEVERCNWDPECVQLWDTNTAFFDALPEQEQMDMIGIKYQDEVAKFGAESGRKEAGTPDPPPMFTPEQEEFLKKLAEIEQSGKKAEPLTPEQKEFFRLLAEHEKNDVKFTPEQDEFFRQLALLEGKTEEGAQRNEFKEAKEAVENDKPAMAGEEKKDAAQAEPNALQHESLKKRDTEPDVSFTEEQETFFKNLALVEQQQQHGEAVDVVSPEAPGLTAEQEKFLEQLALLEQQEKEKAA